ncbi:hypothetical protein CRE_28971 [Caenorhabditis remanei]|uniref:F-box domain-containing protein n=1 Tax=Caenorhabditis remanei TaxID=31234 RepID=E3N595_CAERE|nr:hypothetical protein CRE_28971 [Caenorhabditis remanei]
MTTPFPLLRLPRLALIPVFQHMERIDVIAFSFLSKRTHNLLKYLRKKLSFRYIDLGINNNCLSMTIAPTNGSPLTLYFYTDVLTTVEVFQRRLYDGRSVYKKIQWNNIGLSTEQWVERLLDVTKCPLRSRLTLDGIPKFDVFSVFDVIPKVAELDICYNCCNAVAKRAVEVLSPVTSSITLFKVPFSNREEFQRFWMGNVKCLNIYGHALSKFQFNIDDLLASNAVRLEMSGVSLSLRDLNRFFSCWLNKTSNRRLKHLTVQSLGNFDEDVLLEGLNATRFTEEQQRQFRSNYSLVVFTGGFEMRRIDGQLATITFGGSDFITFIHFDS